MSQRVEKFPGATGVDRLLRRMRAARQAEAILRVGNPRYEIAFHRLVRHARNDEALTRLHAKSVREMLDNTKGLKAMWIQMPDREVIFADGPVNPTLAVLERVREDVIKAGRIVRWLF